MKPSLEELVPRYGKSLYQAAFSACGDPQDAEDAVQETFLAYYREDRQFESEEHLKAWLLRVAINRGRNKARAFWRRNRQSLEDYAETLAFREPEDGELFLAVARLPEKYRVPLHLFYYEDYSVREIAGILHIGENTVKTRLRRGRRMLKETLQEGWQNDGS